MRNLILVTIFLIAVLIKGCYGDDIDSLNQKVKYLTTENTLLRSTIDLNNTNTATSISDLKTSLAALEANLTKSIFNKINHSFLVDLVVYWCCQQYLLPPEAFLLHLDPAFVVALHLPT